MPTSKKIPTAHGYVRRHSSDFAEQREALRAAGISRPVVEQTTESQKARPAFDRLLKRLRPGDVLTVTSLTALGKSTREVVFTVGAVLAAGAALRVLDADLDITADGDVARALTALARAQAVLLAERAKDDPSQPAPGHPRAPEEKLEEARRLLAKGELTVTEVAKRVGLGIGTLYRNNVVPRK